MILLKDARLTSMAAEIKKLRDALEAAVDCGMVPKSSAADGGANRYVRQIQVADQIRAALAPQQSGNES